MVRKQAPVGTGVFLLACVMAFGGPQRAVAAGYGLNEQDTDAIAHAYGGAGVEADPAISYYNPAGMVLLQGNQVENDLNFYDINSKFTGQDDGLGTPPVGGQASGSGSNTGFVYPTLIPTGFGVFSLPFGLKAGFFVTVPVGGRVKYNDDFQGRFQGDEANLTDIQGGLMLAVPITDHLSIGGGPVLDYFQNILGLSEYVGDVAAVGGEGTGQFHGQSYAMGFNAGIMYQFDADDRIGVDYHSKITHTIKGPETLNLTPTAVDSLLGDLGIDAVPPTVSNAYDKFVVPQSVSIAIYHRFNRKFAIMASALWQNWQSTQVFTITDPTTSLATNGAIYVPLKFRNTWTAGVGLDYSPIPKLTLMAGFGYDETPVDTKYRFDLLPDNNRVIASGGFNFKILPYATLKGAYAHYFINQAAIAQTRTGEANGSTSIPTGSGTLTGDYKLSANVFSTGVALKF